MIFGTIGITEIKYREIFILGRNRKQQRHKARINTISATTKIRPQILREQIPVIPLSHFQISVTIICMSKIWIIVRLSFIFVSSRKSQNETHVNICVSLHFGWEKLEFLEISKHHLICQRENKIMGYTIVSDNKQSSVSLHQNHAKVFIEML